MNTINILLIEDNLLLNAGITAMLHTRAEFVVLARNREENPLQHLKERNLIPDVVLLNLDREISKNIAVIALLKEEIPAARIVAMDILPNHVDIMEFVRAGGHGLIIKNAPAEDWFSTIKTVASGENVLPPVLAKSLFAEIVTDALTNEKNLPKNALQLTLRERQVVNLIAEGLSNKEIAESLHIATYTVKSHVHNTLEKLRLNTRLQIAAYVRNEED